MQLGRSWVRGVNKKLVGVVDCPWLLVSSQLLNIDRREMWSSCSRRGGRVRGRRMSDDVCQWSSCREY